MFVKMLLSSFMSASKESRSPWAKLFLQYIKNYRKTGIKLREAILFTPEGRIMARDGAAALTQNDTTKIRNILLNGDACKDVLHLENLYYCVKELSDDTMVLFNGAYYIIACLTESRHLIIINIKARKLDGARTIVWTQSVAEDLTVKAKPQRLGVDTRNKYASPEVLDWF